MKRIRYHPTKQQIEKCVRLHKLSDREIAKRFNTNRAIVLDSIKEFWPEVPLSSLGFGSIKNLRSHFGMPSVLKRTISPAVIEKMRKAHTGLKFGPMSEQGRKNIGAARSKAHVRQ
jgi:hypothetical protein